MTLEKQHRKRSKAENYWVVLSSSGKGEGHCDSRIARDETALEIDHAKESPDSAFGPGLGAFNYTFNFGLEGRFTLTIYHVTEETRFRFPNTALVHQQSLIV